MDFLNGLDPAALAVIERIVNRVLSGGAGVMVFVLA